MPPEPHLATQSCLTPGLLDLANQTSHGAGGGVGIPGTAMLKGTCSLEASNSHGLPVCSMYPGWLCTSPGQDGTGASQLRVLFSGVPG